MATALTNKIKDDYGTLNRFCKIHGINKHTYSVVTSGHGKSAPLVRLLMDKGYIDRADAFEKRGA